MSVYEETIAKIRQLPEPLVQEVNDFVDFLIMRSDTTRSSLWTHFTAAVEIAESDSCDYLANLEVYEEHLFCREIEW